MSAPGVVAVVASTKARAARIARDLGVNERWVFGANNAAAFEGLRARLVLIDAESVIPAEFMDVIRGTVLKMPDGGGRITFVTTRPG